MSSRQSSPSSKSVTWGDVNYKEFRAKEAILPHKSNSSSQDSEPIRGKDFHYELRNRSPPKYSERESIKKIEELSGHHYHPRNSQHSKGRLTPSGEGSQTSTASKRKKSKKPGHKKSQAVSRKKQTPNFGRLRAHEESKESSSEESS